MGEFGLFGVHAGGESDGAYRQMRVYAEVLKKVQTDYVTAPDINEVTTGALHGLLESLDADSSYLTPTEYKIYKDRPSTGVAQIGLTVSKRFGYATIVNVQPGSPADREHLSDGDVIESIGDQSTRELSLAVIRLMLEGKPGSSVTLSGASAQGRSRQADHAEPSVGRHTAEQQYENSSILYLKPAARRRADEVAVSAAGKGCKGFTPICAIPRVVMRNKDLAGQSFHQERDDRDAGGQKFTTQTFTADASKFITDAPLAVLVNRGTYGAAEITAAAIEDAKRGDVVGERTFGEGSVQKTLELPDGAALLLTIAKYESPSGSKIQDNAVTPNVAVAQVADDDEEDTPRHEAMTR